MTEPIKKEWKILYQNNFEVKELFVFIKIEKSWCNVLELNLPENNSRKSININLMF